VRAARRSRAPEAGRNGLEATWSRLRRFLAEDLWSPAAQASRLEALARSALQLVVMVGEGVVRDRLWLRATALAYVSALSLVPALALAVSLIGALGVSEDVARLAVDRIAAGSPEAAEWILRLVSGVSLASLGTLGAATLFATTVLTLGNVERALNDVWGVRQQRSWVRRFADYLTVLVVAPLLLGVALSLRTTLESQWLVQKLLEVPALADLYRTGLGFAPTLLTFVALAFLYWFLPNTEVRLSAAALGGLVAAFLFDAAQSLYLGFNVGMARYGAVFGTFAVLPLFLVWIYVSWLVVLLGAEVAFAVQHLAHHRREARAAPPGAAERERSGLAVALAVARAFGAGRAVTPEELSDELDLPVRSLRDVLADLAAAGIVAARGDAREDAFQLGRPACAIAVAEVRAALRGPTRAGHGRGPEAALAAEVVDSLERRQAEGEGARTLDELVARIAKPRGSPPLG
jgi:membrane protein